MEFRESEIVQTVQRFTIRPHEQSLALKMKNKENFQIDKNKESSSFLQICPFSTSRLEDRATGTGKTYCHDINMLPIHGF